MCSGYDDPTQYDVIDPNCPSCNGGDHVGHQSGCPVGADVEDCIHDLALDAHPFEVNQFGLPWCCDMAESDPIHDVASARRAAELVQAAATTLPLGLLP